MIAKDNLGLNVDMFDIVASSLWLAVLAAPHLYRTLKRKVDPDLLVRYMDIWIAYADRGDTYTGAMFTPVPYAERPALARKLRALLEAWTPPELPAEITETARALLHAEGLKPPPKGEDWDQLDFALGDEPLEDILIWPEGIPSCSSLNKTL